MLVNFQLLVYFLFILQREKNQDVRDKSETSGNIKRVRTGRFNRFLDFLFFFPRGKTVCTCIIVDVSKKIDIIVRHLVYNKRRLINTLNLVVLLVILISQSRVTTLTITLACILKISDS